MSYFATALNELLVEKNHSQAELARLTGIPQPQISRWINTPNQYISEEDFQRLCKVFTKASDQSKLVYARILDLLSTIDVPGARLIEVSITNNPNATSEHAVAYHTKLPPKIDSDIQTVVEHITKDRLVRDMIASLATHLRKS